MAQLMGPQTSTDLPTLLRECEAAESGVMVERRTGELGLDSHTARENLTAALTLDYASSHIHGIAPNDDDQLTANDWTITRQRGATSQVTQDSGPMGTDPVTGAGRYEKSLTLNLYEDDQAYHAAGWRVRLGTVNEYRYPQLQVKLHSSALTALRDDLAAVDISNRVTITNLPSNLPPDDVNLMVEGYSERINSFEWEITFNCSPYSPYNVLTLASPTSDADAGRLSGDERAALRAAIDSDDLSMIVDPNFYRWTEVADDFDPDMKIRLGGEVVEVSGIATTAATYIGRGAMTSVDNAAVTPATTGFGAADGDLLLCLGRIRGTAGSLSTASTGWTLMKQVNNLYLWGAIRSSSTPITVTPSGGAAGDVVSATVFALRGMSITLTDLADLIVGYDTRSNSSAQDIAYGGVFPPKKYPGCVVLLLAGKSDDWTSVAVPSGYTEAGEPSTATGNDQALYLAYQIQTTPTLVPEGSLVVTGGASAVSESMVLVLPGGYQTFTISARSVNGAVKGHAAGTTIEVEDPLVLAL